MFTKEGHFINYFKADSMSVAIVKLWNKYKYFSVY